MIYVALVSICDLILTVIKYVCSDMETDNLTNYNIIRIVLWW